MSKMAAALLLLAAASFTLVILSINAVVEGVQDPENNQARGLANAYAEEIEKRCKDNSHCMRNELSSIALNEDKVVVLGVMDIILGHLGQSTRDCHPEAHHFGIILFMQTHDINEAFSHGNVQCRGGIYHGIIEGYFIDLKLKGSKLANPADICPLGFGNERLLRWHCVHGMGHGLAHYFDYNIVEGMKGCNELKKELEKLRCNSGVFMEVQMHKVDDGHMEKFSTSD